MLMEIVKVCESIKKNFPDLSQDPDSIQFEWIQDLETAIINELTQSFQDHSDMEKFLSETCKLTQDQITHYLILI